MSLQQSGHDRTGTTVSLSCERAGLLFGQAREARTTGKIRPLHSFLYLGPAAQTGYSDVERDCLAVDIQSRTEFDQCSSLSDAMSEHRFTATKLGRSTDCRGDQGKACEGAPKHHSGFAILPPPFFEDRAQGHLNAAKAHHQRAGAYQRDADERGVSRVKLLKNVLGVVRLRAACQQLHDSGQDKENAKHDRIHQPLPAGPFDGAALLREVGYHRAESAAKELRDITIVAELTLAACIATLLFEPAMGAL